MVAVIDVVELSSFPLLVAVAASLDNFLLLLDV